jgi:hypothetical protein
MIDYGKIIVILFIGMLFIQLVIILMSAYLSFVHDDKKMSSIVIVVLTVMSCLYAWYIWMQPPCTQIHDVPFL